MTDQPFFRFFPSAYAEGGPFEASDVACELCEKPAVWLFTGVIYQESDEDLNVCARCIASGALRESAPEYGLHDMDFEAEIETALAEEINQRTPGFATWNAFVWPVRDTMPLVFMGYGSDKDLRQEPQAVAAIEALFADFDAADSDPSHALVFKQIDGPAYVAILDLD